MTGFPLVVRNFILDRDNGSCVRCGRQVMWWNGIRWTQMGEYSIQHRRPRGMGGSKDPATNAPMNGVVLCGSATTGCHSEVESNRAQAYDDGHLVHQGIDPATIPVLHHERGLVYLTSEGYEGRAA